MTEYEAPTSQIDLAIRLAAGEEFNFYGARVWYDPAQPCPFRIGNIPWREWHDRECGGLLIQLMERA